MTNLWGLIQLFLAQFLAIGVPWAILLWIASLVLPGGVSLIAGVILLLVAWAINYGANLTLKVLWVFETISKL